MNTQVVEEKPKVNLEKKPRFFRRGFRAVFELREGYAVAFKGLLKHLRDNFIGRHSYGGSEPLPLTFNRDSLAFRFMDSSRVMLVDIEIGKHDFEEFHVGELKRFRLVDLPVTVGLPVDELLYALENVDKNSTVKFNVESVFKSRSRIVKQEIRVPDVCPKCGLPTTMNQLPPDKRGKHGNLYKCKCGKRFKVRVKTKKVRVWEKYFDKEFAEAVVEVDNGGNVERFSMDVVEPDVGELPTVKLVPTAVLKLTLKPFREMLQRISKKCERVKFEVDGEGLVVKAEGDTVKAEFPLKRGSDMILELKAGGKVTAKYDVKYLLRCLPTFVEIIKLGYSTDMPIKAEAFSPVLMHSSINFWLAPAL